MGVYYLQDKWTRQPLQPQRVSEKALERNIIFAYSGATKRLVYGKNGLIPGRADASFSNFSAAPGATIQGSGSVFNGSTSALGWNTDTSITTNATARAWTLVVVARADSTAAEIRAFGFGVPGGAASLFNIETNGTTWRFQVRESTGGSATNLSGPSVTAGRTEVIVAKIASNRTMSLFMRGTKYTAAGPAGTITPYLVTLGCLYRVSDGVPIQLWNGWIGDAFIFDSELSDNECMDLQANPYQIWAPTPFPIFYTAGGTQTYTYTATGGITFGGTATEERHKVQSVSGGLQFGGSASVSYVGLQTLTVTPSGGITFGGSSAQSITRPESVSGGLQFGGSATVETHESVRTVTPSGGITFGGSASVVFPSLMTLFPYRRFIYGRKGLLDRKISRQ